jgi:peptidoglycan/LPS O-acetylase OafA/YrhL
LHTTPLGLLVAGRFAVDVFFVLSGFVLALGFLGPAAKDDRELAAACVKRVFRLAPVVAAGVLLPAGLHWVGAMAPKAAAEVTGSATWLALQGGWSASPVTVAKIVGFNLFSQGQQFNSALWTIGLEWVGSYFVYLVLFVARRSAWRWAVYAGLALSLRGELLLAKGPAAGIGSGRTWIWARTVGCSSGPAC